jgi:hypothetical protein
MSKYTVLKPFVDDTGSLMTQGKEFNTEAIKLSMLKPLMKYGFIEETELSHLIDWAKEQGFDWDNSMKLFKANLTSDGGGEITHTVSRETMEVFYRKFSVRTQTKQY